MSYLGEKLYELRTDNDIKQKDIANELNIRNTAWSNYEKGDREPDIAMLKKIAKYFNVLIDYLVGITDIKYNAQDPMLLELIKVFISLEKNDRENLKEYIIDFKQKHD